MRHLEMRLSKLVDSALDIPVLGLQLQKSSSCFSQTQGNMDWVRSANGINGTGGSRSIYLFKRVALKEIS